MRRFVISSKGPMRLGVVAVLLLVLLAMAMQVVISTSSAHGLLVKSDPENGAALTQLPEYVTAQFSQELDTKLSVLEVFDANGRQIDNGDGGVDLYDPDHASMVATMPASLPNGTYLVYWRVVSAEDGDATEGKFIFGIGEQPDTRLNVPAQVSAAKQETEWPVIEIVLSLAILIAVTGGVTLFLWLNKQQPVK